jgi:hypothetical protein
MPIGMHVNAWVSADGQVTESVLIGMWHQITTYARWHADDAGDEYPEKPPLNEANIRARAFIGSPGQVIEAVRPWVEAFPGRDLHIIFRLHYPGMTRGEAAEAMRLFARDVAPTLKQLAR